ncbi:MAG: ATP-binding protein [Brevinematales bacterium]
METNFSFMKPYEGNFPLPLAKSSSEKLSDILDDLEDLIGDIDIQEENGDLQTTSDEFNEIISNLIIKYTAESSDGEIFLPPRPTEYQTITEKIKNIKEIIYPNLEELVSLFKDAEKIRSELHEWGVKSIHTKDGSFPSVLALFYGPPGTGKTLMVDYLAYCCEADILEVRASDVINRFVGETQKNIERLFNYYDNLFTLYNHYGKKIFLVINEADQILTARRSISHPWDQESNSVQNMILEKLEKFRGYFLITTNLVDQLDTALWRRFPIKKNFDLPDKETRKKIWEQYLPLPRYRDTPINLDQLASYELSHGVIVNIIEIACMEAICKNKKLSQQDLLYHIQNELNFIEKKKINIGF